MAGPDTFQEKWGPLCYTNTDKKLSRRGKKKCPNANVVENVEAVVDGICNTFSSYTYLSVCVCAVTKATFPTCTLGSAALDLAHMPKP